MLLIAYSNLMRPVDFIVREDTMLEDKPARAPAFPDIHPFVKDARHATLCCFLNWRRGRFVDFAVVVVVVGG